jgi:hypothetical protein
MGSGICKGCFMATEIKRIPVEDQQEAVSVINALSQQFDMLPDTMRHQLHVANDRYAAYYDAQEHVVKLEVIHPDVTKEEIEEFLMGFPPFF